MKKLKLVIAILTLTISSCQSQENQIVDKLTGQWVIEEFEYNNKDLKFEYYVNVLSFKNDSLVLPESRDSSIIMANSDWKLLENGDQKVLLELSSPDSSFAGVYEIDFFKNYNKKLLGLKLQSDRTTLTLYKARQNFDLDGNNWEEE